MSRYTMDGDDRPSLAETDREAWLDMQEREAYEERFAQVATPSDAHREWHLNAGVPMGQPGCPQDACHPIDDEHFEPGPGEGVRCAHCKGRHWTVADVRVCSGVR